MRLYVLYTGGTIGCIGEPLAPMSGERFAAAFNELIMPTVRNELPGTTATVDYFESTLDSTNMQPSEWVKMASRIVDNYVPDPNDPNAGPEYDGFLVLHGTDTMAWTSSALSFMFPGLSKQITVTGSQLPLFSENDEGNLQILYNTDALRNVLGAIRFYPMEIPEVCLYFADTLFRGNRVVKSNSAAFVAFSSPNFPPLGTYGVVPTLNSQYICRVPKSKSMGLAENLSKVKNLIQNTIAANVSRGSVLQIQTFPGYYDESKSLLGSMLNLISGADGSSNGVTPNMIGIIFESYGIGNIPNLNDVRDALQYMHNENKILIDCTQVHAGAVDYNEYATGAWLKEVGVIGGHDITPIAAMAKLTLLLAANPPANGEKYSNDERVAIEFKMGVSSVGELTSYYSLSGHRNDYLSTEDSLFSVNGKYELRNIAAGYIELYELDGDNEIKLWSVGNGREGRLKMQSDNDLVFLDEGGNISWHTDTGALGYNSYFSVGDDGVLALYDLDTDAKRHQIYPSDTAEKVERKRRPRRGSKKASRKKGPRP